MRYRHLRTRCWFRGAGALLAGAMLLSACAQDEEVVEVSPPPVVEASPSPMDQPSPSPMDEASPAATVVGATGEVVPVADITGNTDAYLGQQVTVEGQIEEVIGDTAFAIDEDALAAGGIDNDLLVVGQSAELIELTEQNESEAIRVTGTVQRFVVGDIETELGYDLQDELFADYTDRPVIVAAQAELIAPPVDEAGASPEPGATATTTVTGTVDGLTTTVAAVVSNAERFIGETVTIREEVNSVVGPSAFTLDEEAPLAAGIDNDLLVVSSTTGEIVEDGALVEVSGQVRPFDLAAIEQQTGFDLDETALEAYNGRPVLVADYVLAVPPITTPNLDALDPTITEAYGTNITVAEVVGNFEDFDGKDVTVRAPVEAAIGENALLLDEEALLAGGIDNDLLVVSASPGISVTTDDLARVSGTVRSFDLAAIEQEVGYDLDDALFADYAERPVLVASYVAVNATPGAIAANPEQYYGREIAVLGEVEEVVNLTTFSLDEDAFFEGGIDNDLLVIGAPNSPGIVTEPQEGQRVQVYGTLRQLVTAEVEQELGLDLDPQIEVEYEGRPVLISTYAYAVED